jgi:hypothetical protein
MTAEDVRTYAQAVELLAMERGQWTTLEAVRKRYAADPTGLERKAQDCRLAVMGARVLHKLAKSPEAIAALSKVNMKEAS